MINRWRSLLCAFTPISRMLTCAFGALVSIPLISLADYSGAILITTDKGTGTGFVVNEEGKQYAYSNLHILWGASSLTLQAVSGKTLQPVSLYVSDDSDLVRLELKPSEGSPTGYQKADTAPQIGIPVTVFGNSQGSGLITKLSGNVISVGPTEIEVNVDFVQGNSGSPIINSEGQVIGIATYATKSEKGDWVIEGTRFSQTRRFGIRLDRPIQWRKITFSDLKKQCGLIDSAYIHHYLLREICNPRERRDEQNHIITRKYNMEMFSTLIRGDYAYLSEANALASCTRQFASSVEKYSKSSFNVTRSKRLFHEALEAWLYAPLKNRNTSQWGASQFEDEYNFLKDKLQTAADNLNEQVNKYMVESDRMYNPYGLPSGYFDYFMFLK